MKSNDIVKAVMKETGTTQLMLAQELGFTSQSTVSGLINRTRMSVDKLVELVNTMGYEVIVRKKGEGLAEGEYEVTEQADGGSTPPRVVGEKGLGVRIEI